MIPLYLLAIVVVFWEMFGNLDQSKYINALCCLVIALSLVGCMWLHVRYTKGD